MPGLGLLVVLSLAVVDAQYWGQSAYLQQGTQQGCMWGSKAVGARGQCHSFKCVSPWFGAAYAMHCPFGTVFSARESRCVNPIAVAAQCSRVSALRLPSFWNFP
ncbi:hypothetical protein V1264_009906 [Littorina saxatilis]|uniref:Chitin-binding type-2 domain-containing protein n=1 Tax=Littorina saxatilis TaxID=31220 RepID=A0AAN9ANE0_9CAEN